MPILGAHMSIAGGYYKAVEAAAAAGCDCVQIFTKNNNQWRAKELTDDDADRFRQALQKHNIRHAIAHNSYLVNLASPNAELRAKSIDAQVIEVLRAERLGIAGLVLHPGAFCQSDEACGIRAIAEAIDEIHRQTPGVRTQMLLETTAGQGSCLGWRFEHLAAIIDAVGDSDRLGVCVDTCHIFAAGYPLGTPKEYKATIKQLAVTVGLERVKAFHLNDSKKPFGSRVDRHAHIGRGHLGLEPFRLLLADRRFKHVPMFLETAKEQENGEDMDVVNLRVLRGLTARRAKSIKMDSAAKTSLTPSAKQTRPSRAASKRP